MQSRDAEFDSILTGADGAQGNLLALFDAQTGRPRRPGFFASLHSRSSSLSASSAQELSVVLPALSAGPVLTADVSALGGGRADGAGAPPTAPPRGGGRGGGRVAHDETSRGTSPGRGVVVPLLPSSGSMQPQAVLTWHARQGGGDAQTSAAPTGAGGSSVGVAPPPPPPTACTFWLGSRTCRYGDACVFTHTGSEGGRGGAGLPVWTADSPFDVAAGEEAQRSRAATPLSLPAPAPPPTQQPHPSAAAPPPHLPSPLPLGGPGLSVGLRSSLVSAATAASALEVSKLRADVSEALVGLADQKHRFLSVVTELEGALRSAQQERDRALSDLARERTAGAAASGAASQSHATAASALQALAQARAAHEGAQGRLESALRELAATKDALEGQYIRAGGAEDEVARLESEAVAAAAREAMARALEHSLKGQVESALRDAALARGDCAARVADVEARLSTEVDAHSKDLKLLHETVDGLRGTLVSREDALVTMVERETATRRQLADAARATEQGRAECEARVADAEVRWATRLAAVERERDSARADGVSLTARLAARDASLAQMSGTWERTLEELDRARQAEGVARGECAVERARADVEAARAEHLGEECNLLRDTIVTLQRDVNFLKSGYAAGVSQLEDTVRAARDGGGRGGAVDVSTSPVQQGTARRQGDLGMRLSPGLSAGTSAAQGATVHAGGGTGGRGVGGLTSPPPSSSSSSRPLDLDTSYARFLTPKPERPEGAVESAAGGTTPFPRGSGFILPPTFDVGVDDLGSPVQQGTVGRGGSTQLGGETRHAAGVLRSPLGFPLPSVYGRTSLAPPVGPPSRPVAPVAPLRPSTSPGQGGGGADAPPASRTKPGVQGRKAPARDGGDLLRGGLPQLDGEGPAPGVSATTVTELHLVDAWRVGGGGEGVLLPPTAVSPIQALPQPASAGGVRDVASPPPRKLLASPEKLREQSRVEGGGLQRAEAASMGSAFSPAMERRTVGDAAALQVARSPLSAPGQAAQGASGPSTAPPSVAAPLSTPAQVAWPTRAAAQGVRQMYVSPPSALKAISILSSAQGGGGGLPPHSSHPAHVALPLPMAPPPHQRPVAGRPRAGSGLAASALAAQPTSRRGSLQEGLQNTSTASTAGAALDLLETSGLEIAGALVAGAQGLWSTLTRSDSRGTVSSEAVEGERG